MIAVVNFGLSNVGSVANMLKRLRADQQIIDKPDDVLNADKIVLPGVGSFPAACARLRESGFDKTLNIAALEKKIPIIGICLGMQLFFESSAEGDGQGLGWIPGRCERFSNQLKVPHMGWNHITPTNDHPLFKNMDEESRFYFVHSFYIPTGSDAAISMTTYGEDFVSAVGCGNIVGVQFHPEKSHKYGMALLKNFMEWQP